MFILFFSSYISADLLHRLREIDDSALTEHKHDGSWDRAARYLGLDADKTQPTSKVKVTCMKREVFHWQWHVAFVALQCQADVDKLLGGIIGDDMGLGKVKLTGQSFYDTLETYISY